MSLLGTGLEYKSRALSGFVRESGLERERKLANEQLKAQRNIQQTQMGVTGAVVGGMAGYAAAPLLGASLGAWAGPVGIGAGVALGFLFSRLF